MFSSYTLYTCKISRRFEINNYVINTMSKFQVFFVLKIVHKKWVSRSNCRYHLNDTKLGMNVKSIERTCNPIEKILKY